MKKFILVILPTVLLGCVQAPKNVTAQDGKNALQTSCPGIYISWSSCYEKANKACPTGFNIIEKEQYSIDLDLPVRTLTFRCN